MRAIFEGHVDDAVTKILLSKYCCGTGVVNDSKSETFSICFIGIPFDKGNLLDLCCQTQFFRTLLHQTQFEIKIDLMAIGMEMIDNS